MGETRKTYSVEFKQEAVNMYLKQGYGIQNHC